MKLAVISNMRGVCWAGSETAWQLAAIRALREGHSITAFLHPDLSCSTQIAEFIEAGGRLESWNRLPIARFQAWKERFAPTFPASKLGKFDSILVSLGSLPSLCYVPGLVDGLLKTRARVVLLCQCNAAHLSISVHERERIAQVIQHSAACLFVSQRNLDEARRQFALEPPNAAVLGNPISALLEQPLPWPNRNEAIRLASVARFETAWKGQDILLDILRQPEWLSRHWHLTLYGSGPDESHLRRLVEFFQIQDRVTFAGFVNSLHQIWKDNHILLMPSHGEGMPLAAMEAMMFGRPTVLTDVGGNAELIEEGKTGFLADAPTIKSFGCALQRAWASREKWPEMGRTAHLAATKIAAADVTRQLLNIWSVRTNIA